MQVFKKKEKAIENPDMIIKESVYEVDLIPIYPTYDGKFYHKESIYMAINKLLMENENGIILKNCFGSNCTNFQLIGFSIQKTLISNYTDYKVKCLISQVERVSTMYLDHVQHYLNDYKIGFKPIIERGTGESDYPFVVKEIEYCTLTKNDQLNVTTYVPQIYKRVCLCGSTKFKTTFLDVAKKLTLENKIVLMPNVFGHKGDELSFEQKVRLDDLHKRKILESDYIYVINVDGYIGDSTKQEIKFAKSNNINVEYYEPDKAIN